MLPSFQATFGDSASASAESHKSTPANSCSRTGSGAADAGAGGASPRVGGGGVVGTGSGSSALRNSGLAHGTVPYTSTSPSPVTRGGAGGGGVSGGGAGGGSTSMTAAAVPALAPLPLAPLPLAKHGLAVDGTAYLSGKGRVGGGGVVGTERSGSLVAGLFPGSSGALAGVLEDSTHPSSSQPTGGAAGTATATAPFDLNHSYQSSAVARSSLPSALLRGGGLSGPTASDFSALWQSTSPLRSIEVPPPAPAQSLHQQAPSTPQPPSANHNQLVLGASSPTLQSPSISISVPLPLPSPPQGASPAQSAPQLPPQLPPPLPAATQQGSSTLSASSPDLSQVPSGTQSQSQGVSSGLHAHTLGRTTLTTQHPEQSAAHPLSHTHAQSVHAQAVQENVQVRARAHAGAQAQAHAQAQNIAASLQAQAAGANMLGLGKNSSVYSYVMASGMFDYGIGSMHAAGTAPANKSTASAAASNMLQYHAGANSLFSNPAAAFTNQPSAISSAEMTPPPPNSLVALNALPPSLLVKQEPVPTQQPQANPTHSQSQLRSINHAQHSNTAPPPPPPTSLWPTGGAAPQPGTQSNDVVVTDVPPGVSVGVVGSTPHIGGGAGGVVPGVGDASGVGVSAGGAAAVAARKSRKRPRAPGDEGDEECKEQCPLCPARLRTRVILQNHMRVVHKSGSEHKCPECKAEFPWKSTLDNHVRLVHRRERPFKCTRCEKAFRWSSHLEEHIWVTHEGRKPFNCEVCGKAFGRKNNMQKHCRKVHKLDPNKR